MGVDHRDDLAREIGEVEEGSIARIITTVRAVDPYLDGYPTQRATSHAASAAGRVHANGTADSYAAAPVLIEEELGLYIQRASEGDGPSARRVAELLELMNNTEDAAQWWHRAAEYGDPDAAAYVRYILT